MRPSAAGSTTASSSRTMLSSRPLSTSSSSAEHCASTSAELPIILWTVSTSRTAFCRSVECRSIEEASLHSPSKLWASSKITTLPARSRFVSSERRTVLSMR